MLQLSYNQEDLYKKVLNKFAAYLKLEKILCKYLDQVNYNTKIRKKQSIEIFQVKLKRGDGEKCF